MDLAAKDIRLRTSLPPAGVKSEVGRVRGVLHNFVINSTLKE